MEIGPPSPSFRDSTVAGLKRAAERQTEAAQRIATGDISAEAAVTLKAAETQYVANAKLIDADHHLTLHLLDVTA